MQDRIEKTIELKAPIGRVWRALTDHNEFGEWFRVKLDGPFVVGETTHGYITYPGYEHMKWETEVQAMEPERLFSFTWSPDAQDPKIDDSKGPRILVEFRLEPIATRTRLTIVESGFSGMPDEARRAEVLRSNTEGWDIQCKNIAAHVES